MPTRVKICGLTRVEDAALAVELGASALGFNLYPRSQRYIRPAAARAIVAQLPPLVMTVGVFADESEGDRVAMVAREAGVMTVQLHGPRFPKDAAGAIKGFSVIRAVQVGDGFNLKALGEWKASAFLLDAFDAALRGGTGRTFDWKLAREAKRFGPVILAGGLTPENVAQAIQEVRPFAVDVASGVESSPGIKDAAKLRAFFAAVANADRIIESRNR